MRLPSVSNDEARQLVARLRVLRLRAYLSQGDVADNVPELSRFQLSRMECGQILPRYDVLRELLELYAVQPGEQDELLQLWEQAMLPSWRKQGAHDSASCMVSSMVEFQLGRVPGLLQTKQYARAAYQTAFPRSSADVVDNKVAALVRRQQRLFADKPIVLHAILHEPVLRQGVDDTQLGQIVERAQLPNVTVQIVPQAVGPHAGLDGSLVLLGFADPGTPDVAYTETVLGRIRFPGKDKPAAVKVILGRLKRMALSPADSMEMLKQAVTTTS
jgi:transcriptional regulator with XRE-family HTH domain